MTVGEGPLLSIRGLTVTFPTSRGPSTVVKNVDLDIFPGEIFGLIGETGAGKSLTAWAAVNLVPPPGSASGEVVFDGRPMHRLTDRDLESIRGSGISVIVQDPRRALNPMLPVGRQIANVYRAHHPESSRREAMQAAIDGLWSVGIADAKVRAGHLPHQLSGGLAQRVLIAMALVNRPRLLIADEPTTGLDVTVQAEILDLLIELVHQNGSAVWLITHDLGVIANYTQRAAVMFAGEVVETAPTVELFDEPRHPYTRGLIAAVSDRGENDQHVEGASPDSVARSIGCSFAFRCPWAEDICRQAAPTLMELAPGHRARCFVAERREQERIRS